NAAAEQDCERICAMEIVYNVNEARHHIRLYRSETTEHRQLRRNDVQRDTREKPAGDGGGQEIGDPTHPAKSGDHDDRADQERQQRSILKGRCRSRGGNDERASKNWCNRGIGADRQGAARATKEETKTCRNESKQSELRR